MKKKNGPSVPVREMESVHEAGQRGQRDFVRLRCGSKRRKEDMRRRTARAASKRPPVPLASCLVVSRVEDWADARRASRPGRFSDGTDGMGGDDITRGFKPSLGSEEDMARVPGSPH